MNTETHTDAVQVVCPHCQAVNRVVRNRMSNSPVCGSCKQPLFDSHPAMLSEAQFDRQVANSGLPLIVDFWAPWCGPCRTMTPIFERAAATLEPRARFAKVNTDDEQALAARLGIRSIPTLAIYSGGREVARTSGTMDLGRFIAWASPYLSGEPP